MSDRLAVGVVGCGLIAQAVHLPNLDALGEHFRIAAIAELRTPVREALAERYRVPLAVASVEELLQADGLDAVVVCTPAADHADTVCAVLDAGLHVFCEKPLCITLADADRVIAARDRAGRVVQVGDMKRFDPAYEAMRDDLPAGAERVRYVSVVAHDPEWLPYFLHGEILRATSRATWRRGWTSGGPRRPRPARRRRYRCGRSWTGTWGSLVHFVNAVNGLLEAIGEPLPVAVEHSAWWADGGALNAVARLAGGARWDSAWIQLLGLHEHHERIALYSDDGIRSLDLPSPWLRGAASVYERSAAPGAARTSTTVRSHDEAFVRELLGFHAAVVDDAPVRTPPEQARLDIETLTAMFRRAQEAG